MRFILFFIPFLTFSLASAQETKYISPNNKAFLVNNNCMDTTHIIENKKCVQKEIRKFLDTNFNYPLTDKLAKGRYDFWCSFNLNKNRQISNVKIRSVFFIHNRQTPNKKVKYSNKVIKKEILRLLELFPYNFKFIDENKKATKGNHQFPVAITIE